MSPWAVIRFFAVALLACIVAVAYNNCGQQSYAPAPYHTTNEKLVEQFGKLYSGVLSTEMCSDADKYECSHWIFSQDVDYAQTDIEYPCVQIDGKEFCVIGKQSTFNSKAAADDCRERSNCDEVYEYEEFKCALMLPDTSGYFPIRHEASTFVEALEGAYRKCASAAGVDKGSK